MKVLAQFCVLLLTLSFSSHADRVIDEQAYLDIRYDPEREPGSKTPVPCPCQLHQESNPIHTHWDGSVWTCLPDSWKANKRCAKMREIKPSK